MWRYNPRGKPWKRVWQWRIRSPTTILFPFAFIALTSAESNKPLLMYQLPLTAWLSWAFFFSLLNYYLKHSSFDVPWGHVLLVGRWNLFNENPRSRTKACISISQRLASTNAFTDINFHLDTSCRNAIAVTFNMAMLVFVEVSGVSLVQRSINSTRGAALGTVERKIPTIATLAASGDSDIPGVVDVEESVTVTLLELTCLLRQFLLYGEDDNIPINSKLQTSPSKAPSNPR